MIVSDLAAFTARYGESINVLGTYAGRLSNGGESLDLEDGTNSTIHEFRYEDGTGTGEAAWPQAPDGNGPALVVVDTEGDYSAGTNWVASSLTHGSPGTDDIPADPADYDLDGSVNETDYVLWDQTYGSTIDLRADGNNNLIVDAADFVFWRDRFEAIVAAGTAAANVVPKTGIALRGFAREDVNADGEVSPADALSIINFINTHRTTDQAFRAWEAGAALGVGGDGQVVPLDALLVINALNAQPANQHPSLHSIFADLVQEDDDEAVDSNLWNTLFPK